MKQTPAECGVCGRWTERGECFPSGQRNRFTGERRAGILFAIAVKVKHGGYEELRLRVIGKRGGKKRREPVRYLRGRLRLADAVILRVGSLSNSERGIFWPCSSSRLCNFSIRGCTCLNAC
jgi:hypothetical protein